MNKTKCLGIFLVAGSFLTLTAHSRPRDLSPKAERAMPRCCVDSLKGMPSIWEPICSINTAIMRLLSALTRASYFTIKLFLAAPAAKGNRWPPWPKRKKQPRIKHLAFTVRKTIDMVLSSGDPRKKSRGQMTGFAACGVAKRLFPDAKPQ